MKLALLLVAIVAILGFVHGFVENDIVFLATAALSVGLAIAWTVRFFPTIVSEVSDIAISPILAVIAAYYVFLFSGGGGQAVRRRRGL